MDIGIEKIVQRFEGNMDYLSFGHSHVHFFHLWWILFFGITLPEVHTHEEYSSKGNCISYSPYITLTFDFRAHVQTWNFDSCFFSKRLLSMEWPEGVFCHSCCFPKWRTLLKATNYQVKAALQKYSVFTIYQNLAFLKSIFSLF